jgi:uncharacterized membrane protein
MGGLSPLGVIHTAVSLVALICGFAVLARDREISPKNRLGQTYLVATLLTAATALGIFRHGGFGPPHVLALLTLAALAVGASASYSGFFGGASRYVQAVCYSATFLFHLIPGFTETLTRLPAGAPIAASAEAPLLKTIDAALLALFLLGLVAQILWLRASQRAR